MTTAVQRRREPTKAELRETLGQYEAMLSVLVERLPELEARLGEEGWERLFSTAEREFSRDGLREILRLSRLMYLKNPLINRGVNLNALYVWGQGVSIQAVDEDVQAVVQAFLDDPKNRAELTGHQARTMKEIDLQVLGNLYFTFFVQASTGRVRLRTLPPEEVSEIICNPEDAKEPWFYRRDYVEQAFDAVSGRATERQATAYYPDWRYTPDEAGRLAAIGGKPVRWEAPVYHVRVGGLSDMRFGLPETYQAIDWARAYKSFLEQWSTIQAALARFVWNLQTKGGSRGVAAAKSKLGTTLGTGGAQQQPETNPPPVTSSAFIAGDGTTLAPIRTAGATTGPEEARRLLLMVAAAFGLPEIFFGDADVGNHATAKTLDRPTELKFRDRQTLWRDVLHDILQYVVERAALAPGGQLRGQLVTDDSGEQVVVLDGELDRRIDISFPAVLEHSVTEQVAAVVSAATLDGKTPVGTLDARTLVRLLLTALHVEDADALLDELAPGGGESLMDRLAAQRAQQAAAITGSGKQGAGRGTEDGEEEEREAFIESLRDLREALRLLLERGGDDREAA